MQLANDSQKPLWLSNKADWNSSGGHTIAVWEGCIIKTPRKFGVSGCED